MLLKILIIFIALDLLSPPQQILAKRPFRVEMHDATCTIKSTAFFKYCYTDVKKLAVNRYGINILLDFNRSPDTSTEVEVLIHIRSKRGVTLKFLDIKLNLCEALTHAKTRPLLQQLLIRLSQSINMQMECPFQENYIYNISNLIVNEDLFPVFTPVLDFNFTMNYYVKKDLHFIYQARGATTKR